MQPSNEEGAGNGAAEGRVVTTMNALSGTLSTARDPATRVRMRLLVVDDDPAFCRLCSLALREGGIEHEVVGSSHEALRVLASSGAKPFDLILLDMELPGMRGN